MLFVNCNNSKSTTQSINKQNNQVLASVENAQTTAVDENKPSNVSKEKKMQETVKKETKQQAFVKVTAVEARGSEQNYTFSVTIHSSDTGCNQYADWWEVISEDGKLLYRRVLYHSHVDEQPFTRSGGTVKIGANEVVWVRAHMNTIGYGTAAFKGSVSTGFSATTTPLNFAQDLATQSPLPNGCAF